MCIAGYETQPQYGLIKFCFSQSLKTSFIPIAIFYFSLIVLLHSLESGFSDFFFF
jgi:hypothetical protein